MQVAGGGACRRGGGSMPDSCKSHAHGLSMHVLVISEEYWKGLKQILYCCMTNEFVRKYSCKNAKRYLIYLFYLFIPLAFHISNTFYWSRMNNDKAVRFCTLSTSK